MKLVLNVMRRLEWLAPFRSISLVFIVCVIVVGMTDDGFGDKNLITVP